MELRRAAPFLLAAGLLAAPAFAALPSGLSDVLVTTLPGITALASHFILDVFGYFE